MFRFKLTEPRGLLAVLLPLFISCAALAADQSIAELPLQPDGDNRWVLPDGEYSGQFYVEEPIHIRCAGSAVLQAEGQGHALSIRSPDVTIEGCTLRNWGRNLTDMDSGVFIQPEASGTRLIDNVLQGPGFGIWVDGAREVSLIGNVVTGMPEIRSQDRGNGIHLFSVSAARVIGNEVRHTRDGIYIDNSHGNHLEGNTLEDLRYGVHYMFSNDNQIVGNTARRTRTGYALMQSRKLTVVGNRSEQDENYGILMNYITYSTLRDNVVSDVSHGGSTQSETAEGKALFIYNSVANVIDNNRFERSTLGIHLTAGSEDNRIAGNAFIDNRQQVKYVATRTQEWSVDGRGNYWSDYLGWDRDDDGVGDVPYEPNDNIDRLLWLYPQARLLMNSPAIELLRWVQQAFPVVKSPGVQDSHPLMRAPAVNPTEQYREPTS